MVEQLHTLRDEHGVAHISIFQQDVDALAPVLALLANG
jgi:hypothetical protein